MSKFTIGIDFGTLSARAVLVDVHSGAVAACARHEYCHGVMESSLPDGTALPENWALQYPGDYIDAICATVPELLQLSGVKKEDVIGIGTDFTSCTVMPVDIDGVPLCMLEHFRGNPHAYVKHWKHHGAQKEADIMTHTAKLMGEEWLQFYGGKVSGEGSLPKLWEVLNEAPDIYDAMDEWMEAADWVVLQMTGRRVRNACCAGYKSYYLKHGGYPGREYFKALDPRLENVVSEKLKSEVVPIGSSVGGMKAGMASMLGLVPGTPVAASTIDAHACVPGVGITEPGTLLAIMGTSSCFMVMSRKRLALNGVCGVVEDGILPGCYGYEAGQSGVGDIFAWFTAECIPRKYSIAADEKGQDIHSYLSALAEELKPGESGLLALDWWSGNRSVLSDTELSGLVLGLCTRTKPEEMYRALIEATAFGAKIIVDNYRDNGVAVDEIYASGGISRKNSFAMQVYSDILNMPIKVTNASEGPAMGSAIWGAVAAGSKHGGYDNVREAVASMASKCSCTYKPSVENNAIYEKLFADYKYLHDYFGRGANDVMKRLSAIKNSIRSEKR